MNLVILRKRGKCKLMSVPAESYDAWIMKGYDIFEIGEATGMLPAINFGAIKPTAICLYNLETFRVHGKPKDNNIILN
jgi:hypothetical protein